MDIIPFAVIFDMDGVLVDSNPFHKKAIHHFCEEHQLSVTERELNEKVYGRTNKEWINYLFGGQLTPAEINKYEKEKESLYRSLHGPSMVPVAGLIPFLGLLRANNIPMAVGTSAPPENADFILNKIGALPYFKTILNSSHIDKGKPDPEIYIKTARQLDLSPSQCIIFEDSLSGVVAGKTAGSKVVGVCTTHSPEELSMTDVTIADFRGLDLPFLQRLM